MSEECQNTNDLQAMLILLFKAEFEKHRKIEICTSLTYSLSENHSRDFRKCNNYGASKK